jgi:DNA-directed RNA polymerase specialized sigma24 family protein
MVRRSSDSSRQSEPPVIHASPLTFEAAYAAWWDRSVRYVRGQLASPCRAGDAEDIAQEVWLKLCRLWEHTTWATAPAQWFYVKQALHHQVISHLRRAQHPVSRRIMALTDTVAEFVDQMLPKSAEPAPETQDTAYVCEQLWHLEDLRAYLRQRIQAPGLWLVAQLLLTGASTRETYQWLRGTGARDGADAGELSYTAVKSAHWRVKRMVAEYLATHGESGQVA